MRYFQLKSTQWKVWLSVEIQQVLKIADHYCLKMCGENVWWKAAAHLVASLLISIMSAFNLNPWIDIKIFRAKTHFFMQAADGR
jgi:hypothetical protein